MLKRIFVFILTLALLIPFSVQAGNASSEQIAWYMNGPNSLYITGNGAILDYEAGAEPWAEYAGVISTVTVNEGIKSIGDHAFYRLENLSSVTLPSSVSYISENAFSSYDILFVTKYGTYAFDFIKAHSPAVDCGGMHFYTAWTVTKEATYTEQGVQTRACMRCFTEESEAVPIKALPDVTMGLENSTLTFSNLYGIKDIFFAKGEHKSYRAVKDNLIYGITSKKLGDSTEYSYTFKGGGMHTVYIRFNDPAKEDRLFNFNIWVTEPIFTRSGMELKVSGLEGVKVIRTAYGMHASVRDMKNSGTIKNYTARSEIKGAQEYTVAFANHGHVTVAVEYTSGYIKMYYTAF